MKYILILSIMSSPVDWAKLEASYTNRATCNSDMALFVENAATNHRQLMITSACVEQPIMVEDYTKGN